MASSRIMARCSVCYRDFIPIYSKPGTSTLGSFKTGNQLSGNNKRSLAYFWWKRKRGNPRVLQCQLGQPASPALDIGIFIPFQGGSCIWSSKKQAVVVLPSTEAKYISQTHAAKEAVWLRNFIVELQGKPQGPLTVLCDNQDAIALSKDNKFHSRMKHIDLRYHFIREAVDEGKINVEYIPTAENVADVFMKALARPKFEVFVERLGLGGIKEGRKNKELRLEA